MNSENAVSSLSRPAKEAIKTAISVTLSVGIALAMGWDKPHWAAFAVAFTSLATEGQSINRGAERMFGTLVAVLFAFIFLSWFPQDRWLFMAVASVYVGICSYLMQGRKFNYFWYASGFICTVIVADSHDSLSSFQIAVERAQETGLGILVHGIVSSLLWPITTRTDLVENSQRLLSVQGQLFAEYRKVRQGESTAKEFRNLRANMLQLLNQVSQNLESAETDDFSVWEMRTQWREFLSLARGVAEAMGHWRTCLPDLSEIELEKVFPNLEHFESEIERRFDVIKKIRVGNESKLVLQPVELKFGASAAGSLSQIQLAALETASNHLTRIEKETRALIECAQELAGQSPVRSRLSERSRRPVLTSRYPDRLLGVVTVLASFWISFLLTVYLPDMPGGASFWQMSTLFAVLAIRTGAPPLHGIAIPVVIASVYGALMYILVMPHISGYGQLGALLFVWTFGVSYYYSKPQQAGAKASMLANSISTLSIANEQTYSFAALANSLYMSVLLGALLVAVFYLRPSPRPEKVFLRYYRRFFRHARELLRLQEAQGRGKPSTFARMRARYLEADLLGLPAQLAATGKKIDVQAFPGNPPGALDDLTSSLYDLAFRVRDLVEAKAAVTDEEIGAELDAKVKKRKASRGSRLLQWDEGSGEHSPNDLRPQLQQELTELEGLITTKLSDSPDDGESKKTRRRLFGLLASYRGLAEAEIRAAEVAERINWAQWRESRF